MNTRSAFFQVAALALQVVARDVGAFETPTHWRLSEVSYKVSRLATSDLQIQLGIHKIVELELFRQWALSPGAPGVWTYTTVRLAR